MVKMPETLRAIPPLSLIKVAGILYLYWVLGYYITERPWLHLLLVPALLPASAMAVMAACCVVTLGFLGTAFIFALDPVHDAVPQGIICGSVPAAMLLAHLKGRLTTPFFALKARTPRRDRLAAWLRTTCLWLGVAVLLPLVSREFPLETMLPLSIALFLGAYALPRAMEPRKKLVRSIAVNTALVVASVVFSAAVLEVGTRIVFRQPTPDRSYFTYAPDTFYDLKPGIERKVLKHKIGEETDGTVTATISAQGMRDRVFGPKAEDEYRILMMGDSFTFGLTVEFDETIGHYLQADFEDAAFPKKITTMNMGVPGTAPWQHQIYLQKRGFALEPDLVLHQVFLGNDLADTLSRTQRHMRAFNREWEVEVHRLQLMRLFRFRAEQWLADHSTAYSAFRNTVRRKNAWRFLAFKCRLLTKCPPYKLPPTVDRYASWEVNLAEWYPEVTEAFESVLQTIQETSKECTARGVGYVVYGIPQIEEVWQPLFEERLKDVEEGTVYEQGKGLRLLHARLDAAGIPNTPMLDALRAAPDPKGHYLYFDGHTSAAGNAYIAHILHDYLVTTYFPSHPITGTE